MATNDVADSPYSVESNTVKTKLEAPTGAPRNVRISASSPRSLLVEWVPPLPEEIGGPLRGYKLNYKKKSVTAWTKEELAPDLRRFTIVGLSVATVYQVKLLAYNKQGDGPSTPVYQATTGELAPENPPQNARKVSLTKTSVTIAWKPPVASSGSVQGYKVLYEEVTARRRRRSVSLCPRGPKERFLKVAASSTQATVDNLRKFVKYNLKVRAFNSAGESPDSGTVTVVTLPDLPGPPSDLTYDAYQDSVHLAWLPPCEPNGVITQYHITYWQVSQQNKITKTVGGGTLSAIIDGLQMLNKYTFQVKAKTTDYGPVITAVIETKGPAKLPLKPSRPEATMGSRQATLRWTNGDSGNVPFTNFIIEYSVGEDSSKWIQGWNAKPSDVSKNRTYVYYTVGGLQPDTYYRFRIIAENRVGRSPESPPSYARKTSPAGVTDEGVGKPVYNQTWFVVIIALLAVIILCVLVGCLVLRGRRKKKDRSSRTTDMNTLNTLNSLEMSLARSTQPRTPGSIRSAGLRNGSVQQLERTSDQNSEASSLGPKPELSDSEHDMSEGEVDAYKEKKKLDMAFVGHYGNDPTHKSWKNTLARKGTPTQPPPNPYDDDQLTLGRNDGSMNNIDQDRYVPYPEYRRLESPHSPYIEDVPSEVTTSFMSQPQDTAFVNETYVHSPQSPPPQPVIPGYGRPQPERPHPLNGPNDPVNGVRFEPRNDSFRRALTAEPDQSEYSDSPPDYLSSLERRNMAQTPRTYPYDNQPQHNPGSLTRNPQARHQGRPPDLVLSAPNRPAHTTPQSPAPPYNGYQPDPYNQTSNGGRASPAPTYRSHESRGSDEQSQRSDEHFFPNGFREAFNGPPRRPVHSPPPVPPPNVRYVNSRGQPEYDLEDEEDDEPEDYDFTLEEGHCSSFV